MEYILLEVLKRERQHLERFTTAEERDLLAGLLRYQLLDTGGRQLITFIAPRRGFGGLHHPATVYR